MRVIDAGGRVRYVSIGRTRLLALLCAVPAVTVAQTIRCSRSAVASWSAGLRCPEHAPRVRLMVAYGIPTESWD
jgi:hypothetical protein